MQPDRGRRQMTSSDNQPWNNPRWVTSRHNFAPEIAIPPRPVKLHDLTLRDGVVSAKGHDLTVRREAGNHASLGRERAERRGRWAEALCAGILRLKGYRVLARNWRVPQGEADIIAR